jgi:cyanophycinase-like exopeptidase
MGAWYVTNPDPTGKTLETQSVSDFLAGGSQIAPGLGVVENVSLEPRLTADYRWGRLYGLAQAHPGQIVLGISDVTAVVLDGSGSHVAGDLSVISLDGRSATFGTGSNGAISAYNVVLDAFAPGDSVRG